MHSRIYIGPYFEWWGRTGAIHIESVFAICVKCICLCLGGQESIMARNPPLNPVLDLILVAKLKRWHLDSSDRTLQLSALWSSPARDTQTVTVPCKS